MSLESLLGLLLVLAIFIGGGLALIFAVGTIVGYIIGGILCLIGVVYAVRWIDGRGRRRMTPV